MPDQLDQAAELEEMERVAAIRAVITRPELAYCGMCRNCCEPLEQGAFCDASCAEDYHKRERFNA